jgi:60S ribosome subunit biogenesis protein NIP7
MSNIEFHLASDIEKKSIMGKVDHMLGVGVASNAIGKLGIVLASGKRIELFLVTNELISAFMKMRGKRNPYCLGVYFADLLNNELLLSIEGATLCSVHTHQKVIVSNNGEQSVLYGRDIPRSSIRSFPPSIVRNQKVIITNEFGEVLALGSALVNGEDFSNALENSLVIKNIIDRGWYLRKGR